MFMLLLLCAREASEKNFQPCWPRATFLATPWLAVKNLPTLGTQGVQRNCLHHTPENLLSGYRASDQTGANPVLS